MFLFSFLYSARTARATLNESRPDNGHWRVISLGNVSLLSLSLAVEIVWDIVEDDDNREILIPSYQIWQIKTNEIAPASLRLPVNCLAARH